jgi:hypothetical protein
MTLHQNKAHQNAINKRLPVINKNLTQTIELFSLNIFSTFNILKKGSHNNA